MFKYIVVPKMGDFPCCNCRPSSAPVVGEEKNWGSCLLQLHWPLKSHGFWSDDKGEQF